MKNYVKADIRRILPRIPRILILVAYFAVFIAMYIIDARKDTWNSVAFVALVQTYCSFMPPILGLIELICVYSDDFRAKTMQVAIGIGISRKKVVLAKYIEIALVTLFDLLIFALLCTVMNAITGIVLRSDLVLEIFGQLLFCWLSVIGYSGLSMILIFALQSTGLATILYLVLSTALVQWALGNITNLPAIRGLHLQNVLLTTALNNFRSKIIIGSLDFRSSITIIIYFVVSYVITVEIFKKRELEF